MKSIYVFPYKMGSGSASELSKALGSPQIRHKGSKFVGSLSKTVINWGSSDLPEQVRRSKVVNTQETVRRAGNKLSFFEHQSSFGGGARLVDWCCTATEAKNWLDKGHKVVARTSLTGHSGQGIVIVEAGSEIPKARLYTRYTPKDSEWRIHVAFGEIIDVQRKVRNPDKEPTDWQVRSHDNGFIFIRNTDQPSPDVLKQALCAFTNSGLDFGAVDVIFNKKQQKAYTLEINTAPGLSGQTIEIYAQAFRKNLRT